MSALDLFFGKKRRVKRSPGRKPKRGHGVRRLPKRMAYVTVRGRRRKLYRGANGGLYYRTKSGRTYVPAKVLKRRRHETAAYAAMKKRRARRSKKAKRHHRRRKLKMTKAAIAARRAYRLRKQRRNRFGLW